MSSARNRQPNLFHMEEQMSLELILDTEIKIWFKISVSKIWNRGRKCSLFFLTCFPMRKHFPFYPMDCSQSLIVNSSSLYRTTNITMLVKQNKKKRKPKKHRASDGCCTGRRSQLWPAPTAGAHTVSELETSTIGWSMDSPLGRRPGSRHASYSTCANQGAPELPVLDTK